VVLSVEELARLLDAAPDRARPASERHVNNVKKSQTWRAECQAYGTTLDQKGSIGGGIGSVLLGRVPDVAQAIVDPRDAAESAGLKHVSD
jgi:hypothetical protein